MAEAIFVAFVTSLVPISVLVDAVIFLEESVVRLIVRSTPATTKSRRISRGWSVLLKPVTENEVVTADESGSPVAICGGQRYQALLARSHQHHRKSECDQYYSTLQNEMLMFQTLD